MNREELPPAFVSRMNRMLGEEAEDFWRNYTGEEARALRFNRRKRSRRPEHDSRILQAMGAGDPASFVPWAEDAWYIPADSRPGRDLRHDAGLYYVQEPSAMSAAALLAPRPGERILDLCAAPGGKATQLASLLGPEGLLVANEIHPARCRILSQNIERMGIDNCLVTNEPPERLEQRFPGWFHRILVDAPCSGEGMFRKMPEAMAEWSPEAVRRCAERQDTILNSAAKMLMPGGTLVYSTCTFSPEENEGTISRFLKSHPDFSLEDACGEFFTPGRPEWGDGDPELAKTARLWPHRLRGEGHFAARLIRDPLPETGMPLTQENPQQGKKKPSGAGKRGGKSRPGAESGGPDRERRKLLEEFCRETLTSLTGEKLCGGRLVCFGDQLYLLPEETPDLAGLRVERPGLHLGTFARKRFEPAHALALWLCPEECLRTENLEPESSMAESWRQGGVLEIPGEAGWTLICADGLSAGWGKRVGDRIKNHLPKGLRLAL